MTPPDLTESLAMYADGELPDDRQQIVADLVARDTDAQATVARWRALRRCACRAVSSESVPPSLRQRIVGLLARPPRRAARRTWRIVTVTTAAAALLALALFVWQPFHSASRNRPMVTPAALAHVYEHCALQHHHDPFGAHGKSAAEATALLAERAHVGFAAQVPDFSALGYELIGACNCPPAQGLPTVHAYYARITTGAHSASEVDTTPQIVSFFSLGCPIELTDCSHCPLSNCHSARRYDVATTTDNVTVLKWDENSRSFVVCSALSAANLMRLADGVSVAALPSPTSVVFASSLQHVSPLTAVALVAVALLSVSLARPRHDE